jgi:hypothetical protein
MTTTCEIAKMGRSYLVQVQHAWWCPRNLFGRSLRLLVGSPFTADYLLVHVKFCVSSSHSRRRTRRYGTRCVQETGYELVRRMTVGGKCRFWTVRQFEPGA